jgi:hypothetical protein
MVPPTGATARPAGIRALKPPRPIEVRLDARSGAPRTVCERGRCQAIAGVQDSWQVETEWWRPRPVSRRYFHLLLPSGALTTVYQDLVDGLWYAQAP